jgi:multidrug efflux system membrane fusion protein
VFANEDKNLWPGEFVSVKLLVEDSRRSIVVPASAIQRGPEGTYVYVVDTESKATMRSVSVDFVQDGFAAVKSGLSLGDRVVVEGQFKLRPGSLVRDGERSLPAISRTSSQSPG